jgi:hypothetical protein
MSTLSLRIPSSLHQELRALAQREGVSINQIVSAAVGEKVASLKTLDYLRERARRGSRGRFEEVLAKVPDVEPEEFDRLPEATPKRAAFRTKRKRGA